MYSAALSLSYPLHIIVFQLNIIPNLSPALQKYVPLVVPDASVDQTAFISQLPLHLCVHGDFTARRKEKNILLEQHLAVYVCSMT
jgi:hypothetical protein